MRGQIPPSINPYLNNPNKVTGVWSNGALTLWVDTEFTRSMLNKPAVLDALARSAAALFGGRPRVSVVVGKAPAQTAPVPSAPAPAPAEPHGNLEDLIAFGEQFDNITIK